MKKLLVSILIVAGLMYFFLENKKMYTVSVLSHAKVADVSFKGFKDGLKDLGFIEGVDIDYFYAGATGNVNTLQEASQKIIEKTPDIILTLTTPAALQAKKDTLENKIPIVFAPASNPLGAGLVKSINAPGDNLTGVTFGLQEEKRLEWALKVFPKAKKIYYPYNSKDKSPVVTLNKLLNFVKNRDIEIIPDDVRSLDDIKKSLVNVPKDIDIVFISTDALVASNLKSYLEVFDQLKVPITVPHRQGVEQGAFMSYGFSLYELGYQSARIAKEILEGANPAQIPVENSEFKLSFNVKSMEKLGIQVSDDILVQAVMVR